MLSREARADTAALFLSEEERICFVIIRHDIIYGFFSFGSTGV
jgi:hypothetical protein